MKRVSYSQYKLWKKCPLSYKYKYVDRIAEDKLSIHLGFGTAMHDTIQSYLYVMYNKRKLPKDAEVNGIPVRDYIIRDGKKFVDFDTDRLLKERMYDEVKKIPDWKRDDSITKENMIEFYQDGVEIIKYLKKHRSDWFSLKGIELVDIEMKLNENIKENLSFIGYIDILLKDKKTGSYFIIDLKTSTKGWGDWQKKDKSLTNQNLLYKNYLSEKLNVPQDKINVEYIILKRKIPEDPEWPAMSRRLQRFIPTDGKVSMNRAINDFNEFVDKVFDENGERKTEGYEPTPSTSACRFCEFNQRNLCEFAVN